MQLLRLIGEAFQMCLAHAPGVVAANDVVQAERHLVVDADDHAVGLDAVVGLLEAQVLQAELASPRYPHDLATHVSPPAPAVAARGQPLTMPRIGSCAVTLVSHNNTTTRILWRDSMTRA